MLERTNSHVNDQHISFDEKSHTYTIDEDSSYTSVTTFIGKHFPKFDADAVVKKMMESPNWPESKYYGKKRWEIIEEWDKVGYEARILGTRLHKMIEDYYDGKDITYDNSDIDFQYFINYNNCVKIEPYRSEWRIYDKRLKLAGSIDMVYKYPNNELSIVDWKRSKEIKTENKWQNASTECISHLPDANFWKYSLQLNCYRKILERNYNVVVKEMSIVVFHPENNDYEAYEISFMDEEIENLFKTIEN